MNGFTVNYLSILSGDPTLEQKAKILIAELDLHKSGSSKNQLKFFASAITTSNHGKSSVIPPFCPKPIGEKICNNKKSKDIMLLV